MSELDDLAEINEIETERYLREQARQQRQRKSNEKWQAKKKAKAIEAAQNGPRISKNPLTTETSLNRRKAALGLKSASPEKSRAKIKPVSAKRAGQNREYTVVRREYLTRHPFCHCCIEKGAEVRLSTEVHHTAGKLGDLLCYEPLFMALCRECHVEIHRNGERSHAVGWEISRLLPSVAEQVALTKKLRGDWPHVKAEIEGD